jgi:hypothetical protein
MKLIQITLLAFAGNWAQADDADDVMGPNSYHGMINRFHSELDTARATLISNLKKSEEEYNDFDKDTFKKLLLDEQKFNAAMWRLHNPEDTGPNPYEKHNH